MAYGNFAEEGFYGFCDQKAKDFDFIQKNFKNFFRKIEKVFWEKTRKTEKACKKIHKKSAPSSLNDMHTIHIDIANESIFKKMKKY